VKFTHSEETLSCQAKKTIARQSDKLAGQLVGESLHLLRPAIAGHQVQGPQGQKRGIVDLGGSHENQTRPGQQEDQRVPEVNVVYGMPQFAKKI